MDWREQVLAMDDKELTRQVAERVMGWKWRMYSLTYQAIMMEGGKEPLPSTHKLDAVIGPYGNPWSPLTDWNHCQLVIGQTAMWPHSMREKFQKMLTNDKWYADISQREILETALIVSIMSEPEQEAVTS